MKTKDKFKFQDLTKEMLAEELRQNGLCVGRMLSGSKRIYSEKHPQNVVIFNANIIDETCGKVWYGDLDLTIDGTRLMSVAYKLGTVLHVLREHDGRFENENKSIEDLIKCEVWNTNMPVSVYDKNYCMIPLEVEQKKTDPKWTIKVSNKIENLYGVKMNKKLKETCENKLDNTHLKKIFTTVKFIDKAKNIKDEIKCNKFELAPTDEVDHYKKEIDIVLRALGHKEALVTDMSNVYDFLDFFGDGKNKRNKSKLKKVSKKLGIEVNEDDRIIDVAKRLKHSRKI